MRGVGSMTAAQRAPRRKNEDAMAEPGGTRLSKIRYETAPLRSRIIESMRSAIERGQLKPGERLVEKDLCQELGVSRTSLREALRELEAEGVVAQTMSRGLTVSRITRADAANIYRIRADIEALIVEQFIEKATDEEVAYTRSLCDILVKAYQERGYIEIIEAKRNFYEHLCSVAENTIAHDLLSRLTLRTAQLRSQSVVRPERQEQSVAEINALIAAIARRDVAAARHAARTHVQNAAVSALTFAAEE